MIRDWARGQAKGYYSIHPTQFDTRPPLHINDSDLSPISLQVNGHGRITERPRSEFTMLSYTTYAIGIAGLARESVDMHGVSRHAQRQKDKVEGADMQSRLNQKYETFIAGLPSHFKLGSNLEFYSSGPKAAIPVHRWMLHQQLWGLYLRLHRASLLSHEARATCQLLAHNIINSQAQIQARCTICGSLSSNETPLFSAAVVLLMDLLVSSQHKDANHSSIQINRLMSRDKIWEAIELLRAQSDAKSSSSSQEIQPRPVAISAQQSIIALEALMKLEEEDSGNNEETNGTISTENHRREQEAIYQSSTRKSLMGTVKNILEGLQTNAISTVAAKEQTNVNMFSALDTPMPSSNTADEQHDLDVLPLLTNDLDWDLRQFFDFTPPQSLVGDDPFSVTLNS